MFNQAYYNQRGNVGIHPIARRIVVVRLIPQRMIQSLKHERVLHRVREMNNLSKIVIKKINYS